MHAAVHDDTVLVLRLQRRLQLRQSQRKVVLIVYDRRVAKDAGVRRRDHAVRQPLHRLGRRGNVIAVHSRDVPMCPRS